MDESISESELPPSKGFPNDGAGHRGLVRVVVAAAAVVREVRVSEEEGCVRMFTLGAMF